MAESAVPTPAAPTVTRHSFADLGLSALFQAYVQADPALLSFYAGNPWSPADRQAASERAAAHERPREALVEALRVQNERWGVEPEVAAHLDLLRDPASVAVVTGQQVGLFSGPLYTIYKALTAVKLARQVAAETGRPVVPVFWMATGDHDFDEVAHVCLQRRNERIRVSYPGPAAPETGNLGPVGRLALTDEIEAALTVVDEALVPTDFKPAVMEAVRAAYAPGATLGDAFGRLLRRLLAGMGVVFIAPDDPALKALARPLFRRELEDPHGIYRAIQEVTEDLETTYHAQVHVQPTNLFLLEPDGRHPLDLEGEVFRLRRTDRTYTRAELLALLDAEPERFSPNVVLRPMMQDLLLPTVAYVGGPGEVAYFGQYRAAYAWAGLPMPLVYPRASLTLVESKVQRVLDRYDLHLPDLQGDLEVLFRDTALRESELDVEAAFAKAMPALHEAVNTLKPVATAVDTSLGKATEALRAALMNEVGRFKGRVIKAEKRNQEIIRTQLEKAIVNLVPGGSLQERTYGILYYLNKYSFELIPRLLEELDLDTTQHQVLPL
ncbi:MAG: bacillithiol biosynthesis cysteine-adding enzyme BshC [Bacteroidota bacterium]